MSVLDDFARAGENRPRPKRHRRKKKGKTAVTLILTLSLFACLLVGGWWGYGQLQDIFGVEDYTGTGTGEVIVTIAEGSSQSEIANELYKNDVVKSARAFVEACEDNPDSLGLQAGKYRLRLQMSGESALELMLSPESHLFEGLTIQEGWPYWKTFDELSKYTGLEVGEFEDAAKDYKELGIDDDWFKRTDGEEVQKGIEGFLYPATYEIPEGADATSILKMMVDQFMAVVDEDGLEEYAEEFGVSPWEALMVASIVQMEGIEKDFPKIARVLWNRLDADLWDPPLLNMDSTTNYWREMNGEPRLDNLGEANRDPDNPYQTYTNRGLPPGPICSPGRAAMDAAYNPEDGPWLYFVKIDKEGNSAFAETQAEHDENINKAKENGAY